MEELKIDNEKIEEKKIRKKCEIRPMNEIKPDMELIEKIKRN
jgi:hypothetical protein